MIYRYEWVFIYGLREVGDDEIRYVGQSVNPAKRIRIHATCGDTDLRDFNPRKVWINSVKAKKGGIEMIVLDKCALRDASAEEQKWVNLLLKHEHRLTNVNIAGMSTGVAFLTGNTYHFGERRQIKRINLSELPVRKIDLMAGAIINSFGKVNK